MSPGPLSPPAASTDPGVKLAALGTPAILAGCLIAGFVLVSAWVTARNTEALRDDERWVAHSHQVMLALSDLMSSLQDVEVGQRGYVLTGEEEFLVPYDEGRARLTRDWERLTMLTRDNAEQQARLPDLLARVNARVEFAARTIEVRRAQGIDAARQMVAGGTGKAEMDAFRAQVATMTRVEQALLTVRQDDAERRHRIATFSNVLSTLSGLGLLGLAWLLVRRDARGRHASAVALHEQREWYRTTLSSIGDAVVATDERGVVVFMNDVAAELTGWQGREAVGQRAGTVFRIVNEHTRQPAESPVESALATGALAGLANHTILIAKDGTERFIDDVAAPIKGVDGAVTGVVLVFRDITAQRDTMTRLTESEERFRQVATMSGDWVWEQEPSGRYVYSNATVKALLGYEPTEIVGRHYSELLAPDGARASDAAPPDHVASRTQFFRVTRHYLHRDGSPIVVESSGEPVLGQDGGVLKWRGVDRDITARVRQQERLRLVVENAPVAMLAVGRDGIVSLANVQAERLFGYSNGALLGQSVDVLVPGDARAGHAHLRESFFTEGRARTLGHDRLLKAVRQDGSTLPVEIGLTPIDLGHGIQALAAVVDVSLHHSTEEALRAADQYKNQFLATLAHELRNPLAPIRNAVEVLGRAETQNETVVWAQAIIVRQVGHLSRLVDDLLDLSRVAQGKLTLVTTPVDLVLVARQAVEALEPVAGTRHQSLTVDLPAHALVVQGDETRLVQVATNLLHNAFKYTEDGGRIHLAVAHEGDAAVLRVRDTGIGIAADMLPRVFEWFVQEGGAAQRSPGGLGIGLALVRQLAELHHGSVEAHSAGPGQGSEFVVRLPLAAQPAVTETSAPSIRSGDARRVLIVDDQPDAAESLAKLLQLEGFDVQTAHSGSHALDVASSFRPDVVLLDIGLPDISGYDVAARLRQATAGARLLLVATSGFGSGGDVVRSLGAGFDHHLVKPIDAATLLALLGPSAQA